MHHPRNQIPNKEINIAYYTLIHKEIRHFIQNLYNHSLFIIMYNSQTLLSGDGGLILILESGPVLASFWTRVHLHQFVSYSFKTKLLIVSPYHALVCGTNKLWSRRSNSIWREWSHVNFGVNISRKTFPGETLMLSNWVFFFNPAHQAVLKNNTVMGE